VNGISASLLRRIGQALTALSAVLILFATLSPDVSAPTGSGQLGHFLLFLPMGAGAALWMAKLPVDSQKRARALLLLFILAFAAFTEIAQTFIDGRHGSLTDFIADAAGAGVGVMLGGFMAQRARRDEDPESR